ncbi:hypothetical protein [Haladaptatus sp. GCM10025893]
MILVALLVVAETSVVPRNQTLGTIGIAVATIAIVYALREFIGTY